MMKCTHCDATVLTAAGEKIQPHIYMPDYQAMGDCRVCGHEQDKPWHALSSAPSEPAQSSLAIENEQLRKAIQLHAGDAMSLSRELDDWRERALVAEAALAAPPASPEGDMS